MLSIVHLRGSLDNRLLHNAGKRTQFTGEEEAVVQRE